MFVVGGDSVGVNSEVDDSTETMQSRARIACVKWPKRIICVIGSETDTAIIPC